MMFFNIKDYLHKWKLSLDTSSVKHYVGYMNIKEINKLFKTLVGAGLVMPNEAGARWFGNMIAQLGGIRYNADSRKSKPRYNVIKEFK